MGNGKTTRMNKMASFSWDDWKHFLVIENFCRRTALVLDKSKQIHVLSIGQYEIAQQTYFDWKLLEEIGWSMQEPVRFQVSASHTVADLKQILFMQTSIIADEQKLVFKGKSLADDKLLSFYSISDGDKLFLFQKKSQITPTTPDCSFIPSKASWDKLDNFLRRHFTPQDADKVSAEFKKDFYSRIDDLSLDDIERLASSRLQR